MLISIDDIKTKVEEVYNRHERGNGWDAWSELVLWFAQCESAGHTELGCPDCSSPYPSGEHEAHFMGCQRQKA